MNALRIESTPGARSVAALDFADSGRCDDPSRLPDLLLSTSGEDLAVWETGPIVQFAEAAGWPASVRWSLRVLLTLMGEEVVEPVSAAVVRDRVASVWSRASVAVRTLHDIEVAVQTILARQRYVSTHPALAHTPYVDWRTLHAPADGASPNFRIMALDPPLTTMRADLRDTYFPAPTGDLWVDVHWPHLQWQLLAEMSGDTSLQCLGGHVEFDGLPTSAQSREAVLRALLRCNGRAPGYVFKEIRPVIRPEEGWSEDHAEQVCTEYRQRYRTATEWLHARAQEAATTGTALPPYGYRLKTRARATSEETYRSAVTGVLQQAEAWVLRRAILTWSNEARWRAGREFLSAGSLIPLHDRLLYTLDRDVPIAAHIAVATAGLLPYASEISMGPTAGHFQKVSGAHYATGSALLGLILPNEYAHCPECNRVAATSKILARHLKEAHGR